MKRFWIWIHLPYVVAIGFAFLAKGLWGDNRGLLMIVDVILILAIFVYGSLYRRRITRHTRETT